MYTQGASGPRRQSLLLFSGLLLLLAVKGDGHFPLPAGIPEPLFQLYVLGLTLLFGVGLILLVPGRPCRADNSPPLRDAAAIAGVFMLLDCALLWLEARRYATFGYTLSPAAAALACLIPAGAFAVLVVRRPAPPPGALMAVAASAQAALCLYAWAFFPLAAARSDMLPLLGEAARRLLAGHDPYSLYHLTPGGGLSMTYLPGLLLAYLPAAILHLDPRLLSLLYTLAAAALLYRRAGARAAAFLAVFLVSPYLVYRHEIYLAPFWLLLAGVWAVLARPRPAALAVCCGALILTSPLLAIPAAALAVFGFRRYGFGAMLRRLLAVAALCAVVVGAFLLPDPRSFVSGTLGHWSGALNCESLGVAYWLLLLLSAPTVHLVQAVVVMALLVLPPSRFGSGIDPETPDSVLGAAAFGLAAFSALNTVTWTYFYLVVLFLAMLAQLDPNRQLHGNAETSSRSAPPQVPRHG